MEKINNLLEKILQYNGNLLFDLDKEDSFISIEILLSQHKKLSSIILPFLVDPENDSFDILLINNINLANLYPNYDWHIQNNVFVFGFHDNQLKEEYIDLINEILDGNFTLIENNYGK